MMTALTLAEMKKSVPTNPVEPACCGRFDGAVIAPATGGVTVAGALAAAPLIAMPMDLKIDAPTVLPSPSRAFAAEAVSAVFSAVLESAEPMAAAAFAAADVEADAAAAAAATTLEDDDENAMAAAAPAVFT